MTRMILTDAQWAKMEPHCLGKKSDPGRTGGAGRLFLEAVLWIARTGAPWRDLLEDFGNWNAIFKRFRHWVNRAQVCKWRHLIENSSKAQGVQARRNARLQDGQRFLLNDLRMCRRDNSQ